MRYAREIIRLRFSCVSTHEIARRLGMARSTVREALKRTETAGLSWPLPEDMSDGALEAALYASRRSKRGHRRERHVRQDRTAAPVNQFGPWNMVAGRAACAYEARPKMGRSAVSLYPAESSRGPSPLWTMRGAKPSSLLSLQYTHAVPETGQPSAHATASSRVTNLSYRCSNRWFHCPEFRQPFRQRIARAGCLEATRW
jgi:hypothetical protein